MQYFAYTVDAEQVSRWAALGSRHAVAQAELLPVALAKATWGHEMVGRYVLHVVDNNSVLDALIKGNTGSLASLDLLSCACRPEMPLGCFTWASRVPSLSNLADGPSRDEFYLLRTGQKASRCGQ